MLTENQIEKLNNLRNQYPQYSHLIDRMVEGWKITNPASGGYGVSWLGSKVIPNNRNFTCLIGSCVLGMEIPNLNKGYFDQMFNQLNLSYDERWSMIYGFDNDPKDYAKSLKAYEFAQKVREIVL